MTNRITHRVRLSDVYLARFPKTELMHVTRKGDCYHTKTYAMVRWDGCASFQAYAKDYVTRI